MPMMTHFDVRHIEAGASRGPSSIHPLASSLQNSNRNKSGNRIRHNHLVISGLIFSNRNKIGGVATNKSEELANATPVLASPDACPPAVASEGGRLSSTFFTHGLSSLKPPTSSLQNLIATPANRNALNSLDINKTCRPNRNKRKGSRGPGEGRTGEMRGVSDRNSARFIECKAKMRMRTTPFVKIFTNHESRVTSH